MRRVNRFAAAVTLTVGLFLTPVTGWSQTRGSVQGFGGLSLNGTAQPVLNLGGAGARNLTPHIQVLGEVGRLGDVLPPVADLLFSATQMIRVSALYGEGGVRFLATPRSVVSPYVEASAGVARLGVQVGRFGPLANSVASAALGLVGRNAPTVGLGGGVLLRAGPVLFDAGYRYKQLFANDLVQGVLGLGEPLRSHQVRFGVGVGF